MRSKLQKRFAVLQAGLLLIGCLRLFGQEQRRSVIEIGSRRELFVDRFLIETFKNAELRLQKPIDRGRVLAFDRPWEGRFSAYCTVIKENDKYRLYYRGLVEVGPGGAANGNEVTCYAESPDGIQWTKPDLGLFEVMGTRRNNVILAGQPPFCQNFSPFLDTRPGVAASERYKALAGTLNSGLLAFVSGDGIRWRKLREEAALPPSKQMRYDSQNVSFWSEAESQYVCYFRTFKSIERSSGRMEAIRWVSRSTSKDFLNWTEPVEMSFGDAPPEHLYTNQTSPYFRTPHIYLSLAARFMQGRRVLSEAEAKAVGVDPLYSRDCSDAVLLSSRGAERFDRTFLESFLRPGLGMENWVSRTNYPALNVVQTAPGEISLYANRNYGQQTAHLIRYTLRLDGFASASAGYAGGELITRLIRFDGKELEINYSTSAAGSVRVEMQDAAGRAVRGLALADCPEIIGDQIERVVAWRAGSDVSRLSGRAVRLRFVLKDADLYSIRFR